MTLSQIDGIWHILWNPGLDALGENNLELRIRDEQNRAGLGSTEMFSISVIGGSATAPGPEIWSSAPIGPVYPFELFTYEMKVHTVDDIGPDGSYVPTQLDFEILDAPDGSSVSDNGVFTYRATNNKDANEPHAVTVYVEDSDGRGTTTSFVINSQSRPESSSGSDVCFIATAAFGTPMADRIDLLRSFRDERLLTTSLGILIVDTYYRLSPALAEKIARNALLASAVRVVLIALLFSINTPNSFRIRNRTFSCRCLLL